MMAALATAKASIGAYEPSQLYAAYGYAPAPAPVVTQVIEEPSAPAHYDYGYSVNDPLTGDSKTQQETRRGDVVRGRYSLIDPDGTRRTVDYAADDVNGFNAVVSKEPLAAAVRTVVPAPVPVAHVNHVAPVPRLVPHYTHEPLLRSHYYR